MRIVFIQTGGTIDKDYPRKDRGYAFEIGEPAVERIMQKVHPNFDYKVVSILKKDSLDITDNDREKIYKACLKADSKKILITHGTDTIIDTAKKLSTIKNKLIILTGAMKPEKFSDSDAAFNVGTAIGALNVLDKGVYVAMNGRIYHWNEVERSRETGQFVDAADST
jgi:L-asparaginase